MSRFFELLEETRRFEADSKPPATSQSPVSPVGSKRAEHAYPEVGQALSANVALLESSVPSSAGSPLLAADVSPIPIAGSETQLRISDRARLIPQALDQAVMEHYRRLRTRVLQQQKIKSFRTLLVTSPNPKEGKTLTVLNLGLSFAMLPSFKVLVIDGDLRKNAFGEILGIHDRPGFSNLIDGSATPEEVVLKSDEFPLHFVLSGNSPTAPGELLQSDQVGRHLRMLSEQFSLILVDSPPLNLLTDTQLLAGNCDSVLLVARTFKSKRKSLEKAVQDLAAFPVIGTVLNGGAPAEVYGSYRNIF